MNTAPLTLRSATWRVSKGAFALLAALLFADRIVAGLAQCASAGTCPW